MGGVARGASLLERVSGPTVRLVSSDPAWIEQAKVRLDDAGCLVLGVHGPGEAVPPSALVVVDAASVGAERAVGPSLVVGSPAVGAPGLDLGPDGHLAHWVSWPDDGAALRAGLSAQAARGVQRGPLGRGRFYERALETLLEIETASVEIVDTSVRLLAVNPAFARVTGHAPESVVGRTTGDLFRAGTHDPAFYREIMATLREGRAWSGSMVGQRADGSLSFQEAVLAPVREGEETLGFVALKRDLDRDALTERALRHPEDHARTVLDAVADPWFVHDLDGVILEMNRAAEAVFALTDAAARSRGLRAFVHDDDWPALAAAWPSLQDGVPCALDAKIHLPEGTLAHASVRSGRVTLAGSRFVLTVMRDETARVRLESELRAAKRSAEVAADARATFVANMSHELRTPMNAILGLAQLTLGMPDLPPRAHDYIAKLNGAASSLLGVLNDVLDLSKIEADGLRLEQVEFVLDEVLSNVCVLVAQRAESKGLELLVHTAGDVPHRLVGDPLRLQQVLTNLAGNAVKFTERGSVQVRVARTDAGGPSGGLLRFEIQDTGIGMTPEQSARLFQPFAQADASTTRRFGGTGLGLSISKHLVERMGGEIGVCSEAGRGSAFFFTARFGEPSAAYEAIVPTGIAGARILVADDSEAARAVLVEQLRRLPVRIDEVPDGARAVEAVVRADEVGDPYGLVLMDWRMPGLDGLVATRMIKRTLGLQRPPAVLVVSAHGQGELPTRAHAEGADGALQKPFTRSALVDALVGVFRAVPSVPQRPSAAAGTDVLAGVRLLLVEDVELNQLVAVQLLEAVGARVDVAANGQEALERLDREDPADPYRLVLMDLQMPVMDGLEATRRLRAQPRFAALPIIAMTAHAMFEERDRCLAAGMDDHLSKPIDRPVLYATVALWAQRSKSRTVVPIGSASERAVSTLPPPPRLDGLEVDASIQRLGGNTALYRRVLGMFAQDHAGTPADLAASIGASDLVAVAHAAHSLKGAAATIGASEVAGLASEVEIAARAGADAAVLEAAVMALTRAHAVALGSIQAFLARG